MPSTHAEHVVGAIAHAVVVVDLEGQVLSWNAAAEKLYGWSAEEAVGRLLRELIIPEPAREAAAAARAKIVAGTTYSGDWEVRDRGGRVFPIHIASSALTDADGTVVGAVGVAYDVSAQRAAEARARALAGIVDASLDAIVETDPGGAIRTANPAVRDLFGADPEDLVGRNVTALVPEEHRAAMAAAVARVAAGEQAGALPPVRLHRDGSVLPTSLRLSPIRDAAGTVIAVGGIARDTAEEARTRTALEASERRFRALFEQPNLAQALLDLDGRVVAANDAACALVGRDRASVEGRSVRDLRHPADDQGDERLAAVAAGTVENASWERLLRHRDGRAVPVLVNATLLREADGEPYAIASFLQDLTALRQAQSALSRREALFAALARRAADWAVVLGPTGAVKYASPSVTATFGFDTEALVGVNGFDFLHPEDLPVVTEAFERLLADPARVETVRVRTRDSQGRWVWVEEVLTNCIGDPDIGGIVFNGRDITARVEAEEALRASEARYRAIAETAQEGVWATDEHGRTLYANRKTAEILGLPLETVYAQPAPQLLSPEDPGFVAGKLRNHPEPDEYEVTYRHPDGRPRELRVSVGPLRDDAGAVGALSMISDVSGARRAEDELRRRALHDELTGLANRALLQDRLEQSLARTVRRGEGSVGVLFADLDQFKLVNDTWGHAAGDALLVQVAERLTTAAGDGNTVARFGGDQFAVLAEDVDEAGARALADRLLASLAEPFDIEGERVYVTACFGIAVSPPLSSRDLMRFADAALYEAKARGRGGVHVFDVALAHDAAERLVLSNDLREALAGDALTMAYQPIVELATGRILGVEALARWTHPRRGAIQPVQFVAIAESTGLATAMDRWAVERACRDYAGIRAALGGQARVAVNICANHLTDPGFERMVLTAMRRHDVPVGGLSLEITESAIMDQPEHARALLERLGERGIGAAIDDFGTGYSSLGYLNRLPVTTLKVDRGFIEAVTEDADALAIAASIIDLARTLKLATVAEGIETVDQLALLDSLGCTAGQGFLWSAAVGVAELAELVRALPKGQFDVRRDALSMARIPAPRQDKVTVDHGLHELMRLHRAGASLTTIAAALNSEGFRTPRGLRWHRATVAQVISDMAYPNLWRSGG